MLLYVSASNPRKLIYVNIYVVIPADAAEAKKFPTREREIAGTFSIFQ
jgi:hypothetical protein